MGSDADKLGNILHGHSGHLKIIKMFVPLNKGIIGKTKEEIEALYEYTVNDKPNQVKSLIDSDQFAFYFMWKNDIYGANENSRLIYANIIDPEPEMIQFNHFFATNISAMSVGQAYQRVFHKDQIKEIKIINKNDVMKKLLNA